MIQLETKKLIAKELDIAITTGFCLLLALSLASWFLYCLQYGFTMKTTIYFGIPNYSPHAFDVVLFCLAYLFFFRRFYGSKAVAFFALAVSFSEVQGNSQQYITLIQNPTLAFSNTPPFEGWIYWGKILLFLSISILCLILLKPKFQIKNNWLLIAPILYLLAPTSYFLPSNYQLWELLYNTIWLACFLVIIHE